MKNSTELKYTYGPEVKHKHGLDDLLESLARYELPEGAIQDPYAILYNTLQRGEATILDIGSGWEKESVDAVTHRSTNNWVSVNPMLLDPTHNQSVKGQIEEHIWSRAVQAALKSAGVQADEVPRRALAAKSAELPFRQHIADIILASWSVPTVAEEQAMSVVGNGEQPTPEDVESINQLVRSSYQEYARLLKPGGTIITFPVRRREFLETAAHTLSGQDWDHIICSARDESYYAEVYRTDRDTYGQNFLLVSTKKV